MEKLTMLNKKIMITILVILGIVLFCSSASASSRIYADTNDTIAYFGLDTPAGSSGYTYAVATEEGVFYMSDQQADNLGRHDYMLHKLVEYDLNKYSDSFMPDAVIWGNGGFNYVYNIDHTKDTENFQIPNNQNFSFEYKDGQKVGYNTNAKVITKIYNADGSVM